MALDPQLAGYHLGQLLVQQLWTLDPEAHVVRCTPTTAQVEVHDVTLQLTLDLDADTYQLEDGPPRPLSTESWPNLAQRVSRAARRRSRGGAARPGEETP